MSMTALVILQFMGIFAAYTGITTILPAVMFRRILKGRRLPEQFLMCYTFGNFYIINIVFVLQLLHISNRYTLTAVTVGLSVAIGILANRIPVSKVLKKSGRTAKKLLSGSLGGKSALSDFFNSFRKMMNSAFRFLYREVIKQPLQSIFLLSIILSLCWIYGRQIILTYGYRASDIPVHMNWINQMSRGKLFVSGVYPFGFHCMIYYLHTVFGVDTYVLLCEFFFVQVLFLHAVLLSMLQLLCKSKYLPYAGLLVYIWGDFWAKQTYYRFFSTLPQEFGMIFVIPSVFFLIRFFQMDKEKLKTKEARIMLQCFAMAFSLTLAIHFYGTMIAGLCCIGIAAGFCYRFLRKEYFCRIMVTGILSVFTAVLPMGIAFATGTPLQGSLGWGMSVINGGKKEDTSSSYEIPEETEGESKTQIVLDNGTIIEIDRASGEISTQTQQEAEEGQQTLQTETEAPPAPKVSLKERLLQLKQKSENVIVIMAQRIREFILTINSNLAGYVVLGVFAAVIALGFLFFIIGPREHGAMLMSFGFCMVILTILLCAGTFGLPPLMDGARCSIYYAYLLSGVPVLLLDGIVCLFFRAKKVRLWRNLVSFAVSAAVLTGFFQSGLLKTPGYDSGYVTNGARTCLTNIIKENEDETWTIVSANDETQMGLDHGWHYETITFLRKQEKLQADTSIIIPTRKVYFFIEKIPLDYSVSYAKSGQSISQKGASQGLPNSGGIGLYQGEGRWILMSRMYYWAQAFMERYPNDMKVYYESENFICYEIQQNMYHQYNFAIDYGYNQVES